MNKTLLSLRKRAAILLTVFFLIGINSCRKHEDSLNDNATSINSGLTKFDFSKLKPAVRIQMSEVYSWLDIHIAAEDRVNLKMDSIQQTYADYHHVIKIPINQFAALFFTKENGQLKAFAYKWDDAKPGTKLYTGHIVSFSYQDPTVRAYKYYKGKKITDQTLNTTANLGGVAAINGIKVQGVTGTQEADTKLKTLSVFGDFWCWLTNGTVGGPTLSGPGGTAGGNNCVRPGGWLSGIIHFIKTIFEGGDSGDDGDTGSSSPDYGSDPESPTNLWYGSSGYTGPSPAEGGGGGGQGSNSPANQPYQGGSIWVSRWVSDGCQVNGGGGTPGDGTGGGGPYDLPGDDGSGCPGGSSGHWESVEVQVPVTQCTITMCRDTSITNNTRLNKIFNYLEGNNQVFDSLSAAYKNSYHYDLMFYQTDTLSSGIAGKTKFIPYTIGNTANGIARISLSRNFVNNNINNSYVDIVKTILHETWHAELEQLVMNIYSTVDLDKIKQHYNSSVIGDLTVVQLIDLLNVDYNNIKHLGSFNITANNNWSHNQDHNYMVKNITVLAKGVNQFLTTINSPLKSNMEFAYAEALASLMSVSTYFQDINNQADLIQYFPGYNPAGPQSFSDYVISVWSNNRTNVGLLP